MQDNLLWWQSGIIYQIYPRSFRDSNSDGIGDLKGIIEKLDYLESLGIKAIWLSPIFPSPMADFGYDVADYCDIHPMFGTLEDFDELTEKAHARGMKIMLDLVPNHTSDQHPWFLEARSRRDHPKRDWYIWKDAKADGSAPNNWTSFFGPSAWTLDEASGQYYLHQFLSSQPELNWQNPEVREAMYESMRFWLRRGVDGFRVDVIWLLGKHQDFEDEPENPLWQEGQQNHWRLIHVYTQDQPETHHYVREMRKVLDEFDERMMVGEIYLPFDNLVAYYGEANDAVHLPFNFSLILSTWDAEAVRDLVDEYDQKVGEGWPNWVLGNHDQSRIATRIGPQYARMAQMLLLTLRGTPTCYYGDEIGMEDVEIPFEKMQDPAGLQQPGVKGASRDPERTPMQWDDSENAGFSDVEPWLPLAPNYREVNVAKQDQDHGSFLNYFRGLVKLRQSTPALYAGNYESVDSGHQDVFAFKRYTDGQSVLVVLNFSEEGQSVDLSEINMVGQVLYSTRGEAGERLLLETLILGPCEGMILKI